MSFRWSRIGLLALTLIAFISPILPAAAQEVSVVPAQSPDESAAIPLETGGVPGMPPESWLRMDGGLSVRNVSRATLTPFLPKHGTANGTAVIVAPGGAFLGLAIDVEGFAVARWLSERGIAAFVLKYRVLPTPTAFAEFVDGQNNARAGRPTTVRPPADTPQTSLADARAALRLVRARAGQWAIDVKRIGMIGFSAGAFNTLSVTLDSPPAERPAFIGLIYGRMTSRNVPTDAPPMFAALANDDMFAQQGFALVDDWRRAGRPLEFHLYADGGHGFGLGRPGTTSAGWPDAFMRWLQTEGYVAR